MADANRQIVLDRLPQGDKLGPEHFRLTETARPSAGDGEVLLRTRYISLDAANRAWMQGATYRSALESGQVMAGGALAEVVESNGEDGWESALPGSDQDRPDTRAEQAQMTARYRAALAALPAEQRDVFLLYESGLSLDEIAAINAVGMETAKSRLRYAVTKLRATLAPLTEAFARNVGAIQDPGL